MGVVMRVAALAAVCLLLSFSSHAFDRSQCKHYGGTNDCWTPIIGEWTYRVCGEIGTFLSYNPIAWCRAQGGTWNGSDCEGLPPPELRRPTSEADMQPFAVDWIKEWQGPFCEGPAADPYTWGAVFFSQNCWGQVNDPVYTKGYESRNTTTPFAVHGKKQTTQCSTTESSWTYSGRRERSVNCSGGKGASAEDFYWTTGATPSLCRPGIRLPINPKQPCDGCKSVHKGNPIDVNSGVKRQVDLDYAASGLFPLRFERVYNSRIYTRDGRQWRHNFSAHIEHQDFGSVPVAAAHRPSGQLFLFKSVAGVYTPDTDINDRITKLVDGGGALTGWEYYDAATENTELYDAVGKLLSITNRAGLSHTLAYSTGSTPPSVAPGPGYLIKVTDAFGRELNFTYDALGRMASMQDPAGQTYLYTSTAQNHVASVTFPDTKTRTYL